MVSQLTVNTDRLYIIANTVYKQKQIFNCSYDEVWNKHIHPAIRQVHDKETVFQYLPEIEAKDMAILKQRRATVLSNPRIFECNVTSKVRVVCKEYKTNQFEMMVYHCPSGKESKQIYRHNKLIPITRFSEIRTILREKLGMRKAEVTMIEVQSEKERVL